MTVYDRVNLPVKFKNVLENGRLITRFSPPLDRQTSPIVSNPELRRKIGNYFDFGRIHHRGSMVPDKPRDFFNDNDGAGPSAFLAARLTDGCTPAGRQVKMGLYFKEHTNGYDSINQVPPLYDDIEATNQILAALFPYKDYVPDLYDVLYWCYRGNEDFLRNLSSSFPAGWISFDPASYFDVINKASQMTALAVSTKLHRDVLGLNVPMLDFAEGRRLDLEVNGDRIPTPFALPNAISNPASPFFAALAWPKPPNIHLCSDVCRVCVGLDAASHYPIRTLFGTYPDPVPSFDMALNRMINLTRSASGPTTRPDSSFMIEPLAYARRSPQVRERFLKETWVERARELASMRVSWMFKRSSGRYSTELHYYLKAQELVETLTPSQIIEKFQEELPKEESTELVPLLYAAAYMRIRELAPAVKALLEKLTGESPAFTGYFHWLLVYILGEIGDEATGEYLESFLKYDMLLEPKREIFTAVMRIYHRLGKLPTEEASRIIERAKFDFERDPRVAGVQFGSRIQMSAFRGLLVDVTNPCPHEPKQILELNP